MRARALAVALGVAGGAAWDGCWPNGTCGNTRKICSVRGRCAASPRWVTWPRSEGVETVRLLRDYLEWESQPMLRRRAEGILRRLEAALG